MKPLTQHSFREGFVSLLKYCGDNESLQKFVPKFCNFMKRIELIKNENPHYNFQMFDKDWNKLKAYLHKFVVPNISSVALSSSMDFDSCLLLFNDLEQHLTFKEVFVNKDSPLYAEYTRLRKKQSLVETCPEHKVDFNHYTTIYNHIVQFHRYV